MGRRPLLQLVVLLTVTVASAVAQKDGGPNADITTPYSALKGQDTSNTTDPPVRSYVRAMFQIKRISCLRSIKCGDIDEISGMTIPPDLYVHVFYGRIHEDGKFRRERFLGKTFQCNQRWEPHQNALVFNWAKSKDASLDLRTDGYIEVVILDDDIETQEHVGTIFMTIKNNFDDTFATPNNVEVDATFIADFDHPDQLLTEELTAQQQGKNKC